jgi:hypothetical protein
MSLVRVWTNVGQKKPKALLAKIFSSAEGPVYTIRYLSSVSEGQGSTFRYEEDSYEVEDESIAEWLGTDDEEDLGYTQAGEGEWIREDDDSDYVPESEDEDETDDESEDGTEEDPEDPEDPEDDDEPEENDEYE